MIFGSSSEAAADGAFGGDLRQGAIFGPKLIAIAAGAVLVASLSTSAFSDGTIATAASDLASLMRDRSPGLRSSGKLASIKLPKAPRALALPKMRTRAPATAPAGAPIASALPASAPGLPEILNSPELAEAFAPAPAVAAPAFLVPLGGPIGGGGGGGSILPPIFGAPTPGGGGGTVPPGTGGNTPPGGTDIATPPPPTVSAVPEPSTWMTLIFGFGAVGMALRRTARRRLGREGVA